MSVCLVQILNVHAKPRNKNLGRQTIKIDIVNGCLLYGKMENIKIQLPFKSVSSRLRKEGQKKAHTLRIRIDDKR